MARVASKSSTPSVDPNLIAAVLAALQNQATPPAKAQVTKVATGTTSAMNKEAAIAFAKANVTKKLPVETTFIKGKAKSGNVCLLPVFKFDTGAEITGSPISLWHFLAYYGE